MSADTGELSHVLVLMRHAQAKNHADGGDHERELTKSGRRTARAVGGWLAGQGLRIDLAIVSTSTRTLQTLEECRAGGLSVQEAWGAPSVYLGDVGEIVDAVREAPEEARTMLLVGHAPGVPEVAGLVEDHLELGDALAERISRWAPAAIGVIAHAGSWASFPDGSSALVAIRDPESM